MKLTFWQWLRQGAKRVSIKRGFKWILGNPWLELVIGYFLYKLGLIVILIPILFPIFNSTMTLIVYSLETIFALALMSSLGFIILLHSIYRIYQMDENP